MTDNASEFLNVTLSDYLHKKGITHTKIPTYSPAINGKVERVNRTLIEGTRSLLIAGNVTLRFSGYATQHVW